MSYEVKQGNIFGRVGSGIGKGLAEQVPKEIERYRLSEGLKEIENNPAKSGIGQLRQLYSTAGITPEMAHQIQPFINQQAVKQNRQGQAGSSPRGNQAAQQVNAGIAQGAQGQPASQGQAQPRQGTSIGEKQASARESYYIPSQEEIVQEAYKRMDETGQPFDQALAEVNRDVETQKANKTEQRTEKGLADTAQNIVAGGLATQKERLESRKVPGNVYNDVENKAFDAIKPKNQGGEGLSEQEAIKKYGKELDKIDRQYQDVDNLGNWTLIQNSPKAIRESLNNLSESFKERNDSENFADKLIGSNGLTPGKAYYLAYPNKNVKPLNNAINNLPELKKEISFKRGYPNVEAPPEYLEAETLKASKKLAAAMGTEGSPLAIGEELNAKGYDPEAWFDYLNKNKKSLNMTARQERELTKPRSYLPSLNDLWLFTQSGLEKLVEQ